MKEKSNCDNAEKIIYTYEIRNPLKQLRAIIGIQ